MADKAKSVRIDPDVYGRLTSYLEADELAPPIKRAVTVAVTEWLNRHGAPDSELDEIVAQGAQ